MDTTRSHLVRMTFVLLLGTSGCSPAAPVSASGALAVGDAGDRSDAAPPSDSVLDAALDSALDAASDPDSSTPGTSNPDSSVAPDGGPTATATVLVPNVMPSDIAVGGGFVYYTLLRGVWRVPVGGGSAEQMFATAGRTTYIAADDARFAWSGSVADVALDGAVRSCPHAGCGPGVPTNLGGGQTAQWIAVSGAAIFWTSSSDNAVRGVNGPTRYTFRYGGLQDASPNGVAIDDGEVFWSTGGLAGSRAGTVKRCSLSGSSCTPVVISDSLNPTSVLVHGDKVFVSSRQGVFRMGRDGSGATQFAGGVGATDGVTMYWGQGADVMRCAIASCTPTVHVHIDGLATGVGTYGVRGINLDTTSVYWMTGDALTVKPGAVWRAPR